MLFFKKSRGVDRIVGICYNGSTKARFAYTYNANGNPTAIRAFTLTTSGTISSDATYYLGTNLQGDVVAIYNASGTKIYSYVYDAWGNILQQKQIATGGSTASSLNPFRYRGYYYDSETGWYYLNSRYYHANTGRFINADGYLYNNLLGYNLFVYTNNNPINYYDSTGKAAEALLGYWITVGGGVAILDPTLLGEIILLTGFVVIGGIYLGEIINDTFQTISTVLEAENSSSKEESKKSSKKKKKTRKSDKEKASNNPSWTNPDMIDKSQSAQQNATRMMNDKYGKGNWNTGGGKKGWDGDYNKIVKWITRGGYLKGFFYFLEDSYIPLFEGGGEE